MYKFFEKRFALSARGARDFSKGVLFTTLIDLAIMLPAVYIFIFLEDYLRVALNSSVDVQHSLWYYIGVAVAFMGVMWFVAVLQYRSTFMAVYDESANRRISLAEKLRKLPLAFFGEKNLSDLTSTIMDDSTDLEHTFSHAVPQVFASIISVLLIATGLFFYNWQLSLALFWVVPFAATVILLSKKMQHGGNRKMYLKKRDVTEHIQEGLDTVQEIKSYSQENNYLEELGGKIKAFEQQQIGAELFTGVLVNSAQSILKLGLASVIIIGAKMLASGSTDLFTYLIFLMIASRVYEPINEVFNNLAALFYLDIRINRMNEMEAMPVQQGKTNFDPENYDIEFKQVHFSYESGKDVLQDVSFTAKQGETTALVGPSGSGKSTAAKLASRFWDVNQGQVLLGKHDISLIEPETLLQNYSMVFQDVVLFNASIIDNIRIGKRDATDEEVKRVAKLAQCEEFIEKLPDGYQTVIGENGETLSGGERQRISIARALLKDAPIVLLDEATASLDVENESKIQSAISELIRNKTVLIIAHRMRTVANVDKVVVLEDGRVSECGRPQELKKQKGLFAKMLERQMLN